MAIVKPFIGFRPKQEYAAQLASRPYDVISSDEARELVKDNPYSFLHIVKPEVDLPKDINVYSQQVYKKGRDNLEKWISKGIFFQDPAPYYYIYAQSFWGKTQYGLVGCASVNDYLNNRIKKHELTREVKEIDRKNHIRVTNFNAEPVFFAYPDNQSIDKLVGERTREKPEYDFVADDGVRHQLWVVNDFDDVNLIGRVFRDEIPCTYVADGHHRTAAAAHVGEERKIDNPGHTGNEEYNYFLAVHFPASQLTIIDYNRVIKDLNGYSADEFIIKLKERFDVELKGEQEYKPAGRHEFSMYIDGKWYRLSAKEYTYDDDDAICCLDVTVLSDQVLQPLLGISDLRTSDRVDFVGGIRGLGELKKRVDSGGMAVAFALYPVSMDQLMHIADTGNIMPPKTTWFEPKLRSGLVIHDLE